MHTSQPICVDGDGNGTPWYPPPKRILAQSPSSQFERPVNLHWRKLWTFEANKASRRLHKQHSYIRVLKSLPSEPDSGLQCSSPPVQFEFFNYFVQFLSGLRNLRFNDLPGVSETSGEIWVKAPPIHHNPGSVPAPTGLPLTDAQRRKPCSLTVYHF